MSSNNMHTMSDLYQMQSLSLNSKIAMTKRRIENWDEEFEGEVFVAFSGGKDSTVLLNIAREVVPDIKAVFFNTGIEEPYISQFVKTIPNVEVIRPKRTFISLVNEFGYPVLGKDIAKEVSGLPQVLGLDDTFHP